MQSHACMHTHGSMHADRYTHIYRWSGGPQISGYRNTFLISFFLPRYASKKEETEWTGRRPNASSLSKVGGKKRAPKWSVGIFFFFGRSLVYTTKSAVRYILWMSCWCFCVGVISLQPYMFFSVPVASHWHWGARPRPLQRSENL